MIEVLLLAIALSMDAFAVSIGLGAKSKTSSVRLALLAGAYFGAFQALMPLLLKRLVNRFALSTP